VKDFFFEINWAVGFLVVENFDANELFYILQLT
jgi:hypothetical protein